MAHLADEEMNERTMGDPPEARSKTHPSPRGFSDYLFMNERGLRVGWRLFLFISLAAGFRIGADILIGAFVTPARGVFSPWLMLLRESFSFAAVFCAALIMAKLEARPVDVYGLPARGAFGKRFWQGWLVGLVEVSSLIGLIAALGGYSFGEFALQGNAIVRWVLLWLVIYGVVGLFEEFLFRGYTLYTLADAIGFWPAALALSLGFGWVHLRNPGEGWVGAASIVMTGMVLALTLKRTGSLWFAVGLHASFDFGETFLYSVPNSGIVFDGHLSSASLHGARWLTGGSAGPEGSVFSFLTMALLAICIHSCFPPKKQESPKN